MGRKLQPRESFVIYACVLCFMAGLFAVGLHLGKSYAHPAKPEGEIDLSAGGAGPSVDRLKTELEFYDDLGKPTVDPPAVDRASPETTAADIAAVAEETIEGPIEVAPTGGARESSDVSYTIQVAAHSTEAEAKQTLTRLETRSFKGEIVPPDSSSGNTYYRIWVGRFPSINAARDSETKLKEQGFYTYIRRID